MSAGQWDHTTEKIYNHETGEPLDSTTICGSRTIEQWDLAAVGPLDSKTMGTTRTMEQ